MRFGIEYWVEDADGDECSLGSDYIRVSAADAKSAVASVVAEKLAFYFYDRRHGFVNVRRVERLDEADREADDVVEVFDVGALIEGIEGAAADLG